MFEDRCYFSTAGDQETHSLTLKHNSFDVKMTSIISEEK